MFDIGFAELFLLALVGLLVLGPERLPAAARTLGALVRKARTSWFSLQRTIQSELAASEMTESVKSVGKDLEEIGKSLDARQSPVDRATSDGEAGNKEADQTASDQVGKRQ